MLREKIGKDIGYATIEPKKPVIVGVRQTWIITYYIGKRGIKKRGSIRITIPHTFTTPQIDEFYKDGFTTAKCSKKEISLSMHLESRIFCAYRPELSHSGAFGKSIFILINNGKLVKGDFVKIIMVIHPIMVKKSGDQNRLKHHMCQENMNLLLL